MPLINHKEPINQETKKDEETPNDNQTTTANIVTLTVIEPDKTAENNNDIYNSEDSKLISEDVSLN